MKRLGLLLIVLLVAVVRGFSEEAEQLDYTLYFCLDKSWKGQSYYTTGHL